MGQDFISSALLNVNEPDLTQAKGAEFVQRWVFRPHQNLLRLRPFGFETHSWRR